MKQSSLKNIAFIILALIIVGGVFVLAEYRNNSNGNLVYDSNISIKDAVKAIPQDMQYKDSDGDGLKDWEEALLGTDPNKADDKSLIEKARNNTSTHTEIESTETLTSTDVLARDFFARYMELKQVGLSTDKQSQENLVGQVLKSGLILDNPKKYELKDIIVITDTSKEAIKKYGNDIGAVFKKYNANNRDEAVIAKEAIDKEDYKILKEIDPIILNYKNIINNLLKIQAPKSISDTHLALINSVNLFLFVSESLRKVDVDPVKGLQGVNRELEAAKALDDALRSIKDRLYSIDITYSNTEPGSMFLPQ